MSPELEKHFAILGHRVEDKITGLKGIASSLCFDLYGCIQVAVTLPVGKDGVIPDGRWFDIARMVVTSKEPVLPPPVFTRTAERIIEGKKGPAEKPAQRNEGIR